MVVARESWDLQLGVDLTLGPMGQGFETWEFDPSDWDVGLGTGTQVLGHGHCDSVPHLEPRT